MHGIAMLAGLLGLALTGSVAVSPTTSDTLAQRSDKGSSEVVAQVQSAGRAIAAAVPAAVPAPLSPDLPAKLNPFNFKVENYYDQLREKMNWTPIRYAGSMLKTPDAESRLLLARSAAQLAGLHEVGLSYRDVYGIINAETSWVPRNGASKNGTPNLGIAQFEPATAKALGLQDPSDPVESVHVAALHLKEAAEWSAKRIANLKLTEEQRAAKLREGVSIFYNLSTKGRNKWNGLNTAKLPIETRRHIANARLGAQEAAQLEAELRAVRARMNGERTMTAAAR